MDSDTSFIKTFLLPGGRLPEKGDAKGANTARGYDIFCPYILVGPVMDEKVPYRRAVLWDFDPDKIKTLPSDVRKNICLRQVPGEKNMQWTYVLPPWSPHNHLAEVWIGFGFILGMTPGWSAEICGRSGEGARKICSLTLPLDILASPIADMPDIVDWYIGKPIDSGFRGEPMTLLQNWGSEEFVISRHKRITQIKFSGPNSNENPIFDLVDSVAELGETERMFGSHNSTGVGDVRKKTQQLPVLK